MTVVEAAELLQVAPSRALELAAAPGFPPPLWGVGRHQVWRRRDIAAYHAADHGPPRGAT